MSGDLQRLKSILNDNMYAEGLGYAIGWEAYEEAEALLDALIAERNTATTLAEALGVHCDRAIETGTVTEELARAIAALMPQLLKHEVVADWLLDANVLGPWRKRYDTSQPEKQRWERVDIYGWWVGLALRHRAPQGWIADYQSRSGSKSLGNSFSSLADAMDAVDAALRADGRTLLGEIPDEVLAVRHLDRAESAAQEGT